MARWTEDLTLDFAPVLRLGNGVSIRDAGKVELEGRPTPS